MTILLTLMSSLACWRLTYMLVEEKGPYGIFERLRDHLVVVGTRVIVVDGKATIVPDRMGKNVLGEILVCIYCCSVWVAIPFGVYLAYIDGNWLSFPIHWLGLSACTILVEKFHRILTSLER